MFNSRHYEQLLATALRVATLGIRFGLMFYLAKILSLTEFGLFGLYWASIQLAASLIPLDVYAQTTRMLLSDRNISLDGVSKHFGFLVLAILVFGPIVGCLAFTVAGDVGYLLMLLFALHLPIEVLATDMGRLLVPLGYPLQSNIILFIRSACWVLPYVVLVEFGLIASDLDLVVVSWLIGSLLSAFIGAGVLYKIFERRFTLDFDFTWIKKALLASSLFLLATLMFRLLLGVDRFLVNWRLGVEAVGIYSLYASVALGVLALVESGVSAWHYPSLVSAIRAKDSLMTRRRLKSFLVQNSIACVGLVLSIAVAFPIAINLFLDDIFMNHIEGFYLMVVGVAFYCLSMPFHYCIYAVERDYLFVFIYGVSGVFMGVWAFFYMADYGVLGAGIMLVIALLSIAVMRVLLSVTVIFNKV